jgi:type IV pilus assembly protein PilX
MIIGRKQLGKERGATLLVALIFLIIMAMLGVSIANVTTLEERMASNTRDRDLALQAAEAALRDAESRISTDAAFRGAAINSPLTNANDASFWETQFAGSGTGACAPNYTPTGSNQLPTSGDGAVAAQPRYCLESRGTSGTTQIYRVTARGVGGSLESIVVLQAEYGYTP